MQKSMLAVVGAVSLLAIGAGGIGSLLLVKDRLRIEVSLDAPAPDTAAMLADDLRSLQSDFGALGQALETQFGGMAEASLRSESDRREAHGQLVTMMESLQQSHAQQLARIESLERRIQDFTVAAGSANPVPETAIASQAAPVAVVEVPAAQ